MMKILCAPDSFKETISATAAAQAIAEGINRLNSAIEVDCCPIADGGEGSLDVLIAAAGGEIHRFGVTGPHDESVEARLGVINGGRTAIIELAEASGLALVPADRRDPLHATTFGTGELMLEAAIGECQEIIVCIGGSATVDGGTGIAQALGWRFFDHDGCEIEAHMTGGRLLDVARIVPPDRPLPCIRVACDVANPLCGERGAAVVYGPQKGATPEQVKTLDSGLAHLARITGGDSNMPGAGAAGGAGFGLVTFLRATLERGVDLVLDAVRFDDRCRGASLVLTGEGRLDAQSLQGKACLGVARRALALNVPTVAIVGSTGPGAHACTDRSQGGSLHSFISLSDRFGRDRALSEAPTLIADVAAEIARMRWPASNT